MTATGYVLSPPGGVVWVVLTNRLLALFAIWVTAALLSIAKKSEMALLDARRNLEERVRLRTLALLSNTKKLEREVGQFSIVEGDGLIIACAALYPIADSDSGELACLAVNPEYRHGGRGDELLERIEARARALGLKTLFVLTTRTAHWFRERGFEPSGVERLPAARASLSHFQRNSKIFEKPL